MLPSWSPSFALVPTITPAIISTTTTTTIVTSVTTTTTNDTAYEGKGISNGYYHEGFVHGYYGSPMETVEAQQSRVKPRDTSQGNLNPAPEYYVGEEDIDPNATTGG
ncbi:hypothetical protein BGZ65_005117 [Modicella reniformis]|uniref:Uncharacterized protein n=1 Tax=Modicella reniformis TaxID=1440133 RepID=A0A9P6MBH5_9FUNG|nr:hypothetical protein BGZ65_005117 [Modicella reniformis]